MVRHGCFCVLRNLASLRPAAAFLPAPTINAPQSSPSPPVAARRRRARAAGRRAAPGPAGAAHRAHDARGRGLAHRRSARGRAGPRASRCNPRAARRPIRSTRPTSGAAARATSATACPAPAAGRPGPSCRSDGRQPWPSSPRSRRTRARELFASGWAGRAARAARHPGRHREHQLLRHHRAGRPAVAVGADAVRAPVHDQLPFYLHLMKHLAQPRHPGARPAGRPRRRHPAHRCAASRPPWSTSCRPQRTGAHRRPLRQRRRDAGPHAPGRARLRPQPAQPARPGLVERDGAGGAALRLAAAGRPAAQRTGLPEPRRGQPPPTPPCRAARCTPTCSATT
jgi:hypothetical protein